MKRVACEELVPLAPKRVFLPKHRVTDLCTYVERALVVDHVGATELHLGRQPLVLVALDESGERERDMHLCWWPRRALSALRLLRWLEDEPDHRDRGDVLSALIQLALGAPAERSQLDALCKHAGILAALELGEWRVLNARGYGYAPPLVDEDDRVVEESQLDGALKRIYAAL